ncbi:MAG: hypothetical protein ACE15C_00855 [Phycisphaerae bacterium]
MADAPAQDGGGGPLRRLWAADGRAVVWACVATVAVELGVLLAALGGLISQSYQDRGREQAKGLMEIATGLPLQYPTMGFLAACCVWAALASGVMAAGGRGWISATLRGGVIADATGISLLAAWLLGLAWPAKYQVLGFLDIVEIYCTFAVLSLAAVAAVQCARGPAGRYAIAVASAVALMAALATPFWTGGIREHARPESRYRIVATAAEFNPFYSVSLPVARRTDKPWSLYDVMYKDVRFAQNQAVGAIHWYDSVVRYGVIAVMLVLVSVVRGRFIDRKLANTHTGAGT